MPPPAPCHCRPRGSNDTAEAGSNPGGPEPAVIVAGFVRIVIEAEVGVGPALPDVPIGKAARAGPGGRVRQPGVLRQPGSLQRIAHRAGTVDADLVLGPAAVRGGQTRSDAAEILVDRIQILAPRIEIDREIDRAARGLADR